MEEGQKLYKEKGMEKSAVILASTVLTLQFKTIAKKSGIYEWERYIVHHRLATLNRLQKTGL